MIEVSDLPGNLIGRFEGRDHGSSVSFFIGTFPTGTGPGLHAHPYDETFIVEAGSAPFTIGDDEGGDRHGSDRRGARGHAPHVRQR